MAKRRFSKKPRTITPARVVIFAIMVIAAILMADSIAMDDNADQSREPVNKEFGDLTDVKTSPAVPEVRRHYTGFELSFNPKAHIPNWVAWELTADEAVGKEPRAKKFMNDPKVDGCAETWDYSYSGYDRGHMAPAGDMKWNRKAMEESFYLTNICPQANTLNSGSWRTLEEKCREWARKYGSVWIVCGPVMDGKPMEYIGDSRVYVPSAFFKAIIAPSAQRPLGIGFIMPNGKVKGGMQTCVVSIDSIESLTGHDFFHTLPDGLENDLESQHNLNRWTVR